MNGTAIDGYALINVVGYNGASKPTTITTDGTGNDVFTYTEEGAGTGTAANP
ncbi:hypothetical protein FACS1894166_12490 [Bacilli bacterium]|nr:hypothetical protein FACS1894166_12490 [Bacilli bacterium]